MPRNAPVPHTVSSARISERRPEFNGGGRADGFARFPGRIPAAPGKRQECGEAIRAQSRRPISTQSWVLRRSAMLMASQMPIAINATVKAKAAIFASMRWRKSSGSSRVSLIARKIVRFLPDIARLAVLARRLGHRARPELEHAVLVIRHNWPLAFHRCLIRDIRSPLVSLPRLVSQTKSAWHACDNSFLTGAYGTRHSRFSRPMLISGFQRGF